jgi:hypothetical protein
MKTKAKNPSAHAHALATMRLNEILRFCSQEQTLEKNHCVDADLSHLHRASEAISQGLLVECRRQKTKRGWKLNFAIYS